MRVVAGAYRGRRLAAPAGRSTRPTSDRVREALFSILGDVEGLRVLDLFAGSGALGIEALSRGAARRACRHDRAALAAIRATSEPLSAADADVVRADALAWLGGGGAHSTSCSPTRHIVRPASWQGRSPEAPRRTTSASASETAA